MAGTLRVLWPTYCLYHGACVLRTHGPDDLRAFVPHVTSIQIGGIRTFPPWGTF